MTINQLIENRTDPDTLTDAEVKGLSYGIEYFGCSEAGITDPELVRVWCEMRPKLVARLKKLTVKPAQPAPEPHVLCQCGHNVSRGQVMSTSSGSSCPRCYDRMSD